MDKSVKSLLVLVGAVCTIIVFMFNDNNIYPLYFLVPFVFTVYTALEKKILTKVQNNLGYALFFISAFIRYLIMPLIFCFSEDISSSGSVAASPKELEQAIILQIYEEVCVLILLGILTNRRNNKYIMPAMRRIKTIDKRGLYFVAILFVPIVFFFMRDMIAGMNFVWNLTEAKMAESTIVTLPLAGLFSTLFNFGRILIILLYIDFLIKTNTNSKTSIFICMVLIILYAAFITNLSRMGIVLPLVTFGYLLVFCFPSQKKRVFTWGTVILVGAIIGMTYLKSFSDVRNVNNDEASDVTYWANSLQAYFMGIKNIAIGLRADSMVDRFFGDNRLLFFLNDNIANIAGLSHFSANNLTSVYIFNYNIHTSDAMDQICPNIINGYMYFGKILSPLYSLMFVYLMVFFDNKSRLETRLVEKYCWVFAAASCGLFMMVGGPMVVSFLINNSVLLFLYTKLNKML